MGYKKKPRRTKRTISMQPRTHVRRPFDGVRSNQRFRTSRSSERKRSLRMRSAGEACMHLIESGQGIGTGRRSLWMRSFGDRDNRASACRSICNSNACRGGKMQVRFSFVMPFEGLFVRFSLVLIYLMMTDHQFANRRPGLLIKIDYVAAHGWTIYRLII